MVLNVPQKGQAQRVKYQMEWGNTVSSWRRHETSWYSPSKRLSGHSLVLRQHRAQAGIIRRCVLERASFRGLRLGAWFRYFAYMHAFDCLVFACEHIHRNAILPLRMSAEAYARITHHYRLFDSQITQTTIPVRF